MFWKKKKVEFDPEPEVTDEAPLVPYRVLYTDLAFYLDPECRNEVSDARIVILEAQDRSDALRELDVVPTRKCYQPGQLVNWRLNKERQWEEAWFRHPDTQKIERAWTMHVEFVGQLISEAAFNSTHSVQGQSRVS